MIEQFESRTPQSLILKKLIAYYYFHRSGDDSSIQSFIYYPHYKNALSIYKNSDLQLENTYTTITKPADCGYSFGFAKLINHAAKAKIYPPFDKVAIAFQPLGLNNFISGKLSDHIKNPIQLPFNYFKNSIQTVLDQVYDTEDLDQKVTLLDDYFLSIYKGFHEEKMEKAMNLLMKQNSKYTVKELAEELEISRKTLLRLFKKHHNCSAIDYIKLVQFRRAIEIFQNSNSQASLTDLAHDTSYYDQSDFIHHFKKLTGYNPKSFFKNLSNIGNQDTYWTFN